MSNKKKLRFFASTMLILIIFGYMTMLLCPVCAQFQAMRASEPEIIIQEVIKEVVVEKEIVVEKEVVVEKNTFTGYKSIDVPNVNSSFKAFMDYRKLTNKNSIQYKMQQKATTDKLGFRKYEECYMIALGTFYSNKCGEKFIIKFDSGITINAIIGDIKDDKHTNSTHQYTINKNNMIEFIVDTKKLNKETRARGDVSYSGFLGKITEIHKKND